jgi:eukaryotic-like serine/threonine-protein kinase
MIAKEFAHYRVQGRIGHGGMGEVYLADDLALKRKVALKFLLPAGAVAPLESVPPDAEIRQRLLREARASAQLDHPYICKVYEVGEHEGRAFLAMEYVEGVTLKERLDTGRPSISESVRIGAEVAEALHFAHTRGIIHRDVKPANVMLADNGHVKVMDFGVAKRVAPPLAADDVTSEALTATPPGEPTGTLAYMSPEQIRAEPIDARSDVFAFGVLLHELLAGVHPFKRSSPLETAHAILNEAAPPLDQTGASPLLAHIVSRCLEKDPARRYQSLGDVRLELDAVQRSSTHVDRQYRAGRWTSAAAALIVILAAVAIYWMRPGLLFAPEPVLAFKERDWIVVSDFNNLTSDPVFDKSLRLALEVAIAQSRYVNVYPPDRVAATLRRMNRKPDRFDETLASEVAVRDGIRGVLACDIAQVGSVYAITARLIDPKTRAAVFTDQVHARNKDAVLGELGDLASRVRGSLGESLAGLSAQVRPLPMVTTSSLEALKLYSEATNLGTRDAGESNRLLQQAIALDPDFALASAELGRRYYLASARAVREEAEQLFAKALGQTERLSLRERLWIQAVAEDSRGNREQAVVAYKAYLGQYPDDSTGWFRLAWTQMATLGQYEDSVKGFKEVIRLQPNDLAAHVNLASAYSGLRNFEAAIPAYQRAFALEPSAMFGTFVNHEYGFTLVHAGRLSEAEAVFERMKKEADLANKPKGHRSLALLQMYRGQYASASEELRRAVVLDRTTQEPISEFRDRQYLVRALDARDQRREANAAWKEVEQLIARLSLAPSWLWEPVRRLARRGQTADAQRLVTLMQKTAGSATADSSVARNVNLDRAYINLAQAEIDLAGGRPERAIELLEPGREILKLGMADSLAAAYAAAGRLPAAVSLYEELMRAPFLGNEMQERWFESHIALGGLYERLARPDDARRLYTELVERWKDGDSDLVLLKAARERLARLGPAAASVPK